MKQQGIIRVLSTTSLLSLLTVTTSFGYEYRANEGTPSYYDSVQGQYNNSFQRSNCPSHTCHTVQRNVTSSYNSILNYNQSSYNTNRQVSYVQPQVQQQQVQQVQQQSAYNKNTLNAGAITSPYQVNHGDDSWDLGVSVYDGTSSFKFNTISTSDLRWWGMATHGVDLTLRKNWKSSAGNKYFIDGAYGKGSTKTDYTTDDDVYNPLVMMSVGQGDGNLTDYKLGFGYESKYKLLGFTMRPVFGYKRKETDLRMLNHVQPITYYMPGGGNCTSIGGQNVVDTSGVYPNGMCKFSFNATQISGFYNADTGVYYTPNAAKTAFTASDGSASVTNIYAYTDAGTVVQMSSTNQGEYELGDAYYSTTDQGNSVNINGSAGTLFASGIDMTTDQEFAQFHTTPDRAEVIPGGGVTQEYNVTWDGLYAGLELEKAFSMRDYLTFYSELFYGRYNADANWPARLLTFQDATKFGGALGMHLSLKYNYIIQDSWTFFAGWDYDYMQSKNADESWQDANNGASGTDKNFIKSAIWKYTGFRVGIKAGF